MWLKTQGGKLVNLDNTARIFIADKKAKWSSNFESCPAVYAQFSDGNSEAFDSVLFEAEHYKAYERKASWQITDEDRNEILKRGREECQLYIDTLFGLITRRKSMQAIGHKEIAYLMEEQIKAGKHPNLSTPEEEKADAA
tara:strand:- start:25261 stop:25680 length:420 start_codon:yes stop_codon:yes gene_type:complete